MARDSDVARQSNLEMKYTKQELLKDAFFGEFYVYTDNANDSKIICIEKLLSDKEALKRDIEQIKKKILNKHDYVLNLLDYSVEVQSNLCSTFYLLKTFYEHPNKSLKKEINERKLQGGSAGNFKNTDLTHLLYHQIIAHSYLQDNKIPHGDISPSTIFISSKGDYKVAFRLNNKMAMEKLQLEKLMKNEPVYLSPALYSALKRRNLSNIVHSSIKSDVFSFGLCLLEAGLLRSIQSIYSKGDEIDQHMLNIYLDEYEMKYADNPLLFSSVRKMCEIDETDRPSFTDLKLALPDYAEICDYFYKVEHGLINEEEEPWDENSPDPHQNFQQQDYDAYQPEQTYGQSQQKVNVNAGYDQDDYVPMQQNYQEQPKQIATYDSNPYSATQANAFSNTNVNTYSNTNTNVYSNPASNQNNQFNGGYQNNQVQPPVQNQYNNNTQNVNAYNSHSQPTTPQNNLVQTTGSNFFDKYADFDFFGESAVQESPASYSQPQNLNTQNQYSQNFNNTQNTYSANNQYTANNQYSGNNQVIQNDNFFTEYKPNQPKVSHTSNTYNQPVYGNGVQKRPDSTITYGSATNYTNDLSYNQSNNQPHQFKTSYSSGQNNTLPQAQVYGQTQPQVYGQNQQFYRGY